MWPSMLDPSSEVRRGSVRARVGFIGIGTMGGGMARRLADEGFSVVAFDLRESVVRDAALHPGITAVSLGPELACSIVVTMLPDGAAVRAATKDLLPLLDPGAIIVDSSSSAPEDTLALADRASSWGVQVIDAPVSGNPASARSGGLTLMVGGDERALRQARPVLDAFGRVFHVGPSGAGHALKALNNLLSSINLAAAAEVLLAGAAFGIRPDVVLEVINASTGRSHASETKMRSYLAGDSRSGFALRLMLKDMRIANDLLDTCGGPGSLGRACLDLWERAEVELSSGADNLEIVSWLARFAASAKGGV